MKVYCVGLLIVLPSRLQQHETGFLFGEASLHSDDKKIDLVHNQDILFQQSVGSQAEQLLKICKCFTMFYQN